MLLIAGGLAINASLFTGAVNSLKVNHNHNIIF